MAGLGRACLLLVLGVCGYGVFAGLYAARFARSRGARESWLESARRSVYAVAFLTTVAMAVLEIAFLRNDFRFYTVATTSSRTTPELYRAAAIWASQEGSLLLWTWLLSLWSSLILFLTRRRLREAAPYATAILLGFAAFFDSLMIFYANPFQTLRRVPTEGDGLDPLLRFPTMILHPPMLYSGYTLSIIPFAFAAGALLARRIDAQWIRMVRRFALASWLFLGAGILLGARWSFAELGWGGYWGWDPVENAALLPWLTGTAFIHSLMIQERRGMLKVWNASLVLATGTLSVMGTFLVRSGVLDSIHAFGASTLGVPFVILIALMIIGSIYLVVSRLELLRSDHRLESLLSREAAFLANNLVLVGLCFVVFWGTYFPLISKAINGQQASVGPPWFDRYTVPLALILVALTGIGPIIPWRRASWAGLRRHLAAPAGVAVVVAIVVGYAGAAASPSALAAVSLCSFAVAITVGEVWRGVRVRMAVAGELLPVALVRLVSRNRRRYGGYLVHTGIAVLIIGVAASSSFLHQQERQLQIGQSIKVGLYQVKYVKPTAALLNGPDHTGATIDIGAVLEATKGGKRQFLLKPSEGFYPTTEPGQGPVSALIGGQAVSHVAISSGFGGDFWSAVEPNIHTPRLTEILERANRIVSPTNATQAVIALAVLLREYLRNPPPAQFNLISYPFVEWVWLGGLIGLLGALIALVPPPPPLPARLRARVGAALGVTAGG